MKRHLFAAVLAAAVVPVVTTWSGGAVAQQAASALSDEVKLKDGSVFRGTITELVPRDHVDLMLASGQTRRFAAADIAYAGPAKRPPASGPPGADSGPRGRGVDVHVVANEDDVQLLIRTGQGEVEGAAWGYHGAVAYEGVARDYAIVCTAPCDAQLPPGLQRLALSHHGGRTVEADDPVELRGPSTLRAQYESRQGVRIAGYVVGIGSFAAGLVLIFTNLPTCPPQQSCNFPSAFWAGAVVIIAGGILGSILAGVGDHAALQLVPTGTSRMLKLPGVGEPVADGPVDGAGLGLRFSF